MNEPPPAAVIARPGNPFPGLRYFDESFAPYFFGRDDDLIYLFSNLLTERFVAIAGDSATGKSSLMRGGYLPQLRADKLPNGISAWCTVELTPGEWPFANLARALLAAQPRIPG